MESGWLQFCLQGIATYWLQWLIGVVMTIALTWWAKIKNNLSWPMMIVFGLVVVTCFTVLYSHVSEWARDYFREAKTVEEQVKGWLDSPNYRLTRSEAPATELFRFTVNLPHSNLPITILQLKSDPSFIQISMSLQKDQQMEDLFSKIGPLEAERIKSKIYLELLRSGAQYTTRDNQNFLVFIFDRIPFDKTVTKRAFLTSLLNLHTSALSASSVYNLESISYSISQEITRKHYRKTRMQ